MSNQSIKILIIENSGQDEGIFSHLLPKNVGIDYIFLREKNGHTGIDTCFEKKPDCVLVDVDLPDINGLEVIKKINPNPLNPTFPIILLASANDESTALKSLQTGAQDYLIKDEISLREIKRAIHKAIELVNLHQKHNQAQEELSSSQEQLNVIFNQAAIGICQIDMQGKYVLVNDKFCEIVGRTREELLKIGLQDITHPEDLKPNLELIEKVRQGNAPPSINEKRYVRPDQTTVWVRASINFIYDTNCKAQFGFATMQDITESKLAEQKLQLKQDELKDFIENASVGLHWVDGDGIIIWANRAEMELLGYAAEEYIGHSIADFHADTATINDILTRLKNGETLFNYEASLRCKDRSLRYVLINSNVFRKDGKFVHTRCFTRDITERRYAEENLRQSEERFRTLADNMSQFAWMCDELGVAIWYNQRWYDYTGTTPDEMKERGWEKVHHPDHLERVIKKLQHSLETGEIWEDTFPLRSKEGKYRWFLSRALPICDENNKIIRWFGTNTDITETKLTEEKLRLSEAHLSALVNQSVTAIIETDLTGQYLLINDQYCELTGYSREELVGKMRMQEITHPEDLPQNLVYFQTLVNEGTAFNIEKRYIRKDGGIIWVSKSVSAVRDDAGNLKSIVAVIVDITQRKETEARLRESQLFSQSIIEAAPTLTYIYDINETRNVFISPQAIEVLGYTPEEITSMGSGVLSNLLHPDDVPLAAKRFKKIIASTANEIFELEYRMQCKDGSWVWLFSRDCVFKRDENGAPTQLLGVSTDITSRKRAEKEREELLEREQHLRLEAESANRAKDEFLAILSHELRTPLNAMFGWTQILKMNDLNAEQTDHAIEVINRNVRLQNALIEDLLDVSRIISGKMQLESEVVSLISIIKSTIDANRPVAEKQGVQIQSTLDPFANDIIGDQPRLQQIINNLLTNAIKFTPTGGTIKIELKPIGNKAKLTITDSGIGIEPDILPHIFDRFKQADASSKRKYGGLGLGLTIVKHLVELHGGSVAAYSEGLKKGATFTIELPLVAVLVPSADFDFLKAGNKENSKNDKPLANLRILMVDDDADALNLMRFALESKGAQIVCVNSANQALIKIKDEKFDLLISDLGMAEMDGYDLIRNVRENEISTDKMLPAIAVTGYVSVEERERVLDSGFQYHLPKPVIFEQLQAVIFNLMNTTK